MAKAHRLDPFDDLNIIGSYAQRFGLDPDVVFIKTSFGTIMNFLTMWKEMDEFNERFAFIWQEINKEPDRK